ncbi:hypothetical protein [Sporolactobacillus terrae]|uniref:hypothetical protein n=1 Tax=Sporolactobacillus terrae TaxID=269673 RepID=UPI00048B97D0|nr:hypothetical protein [Sporolactobacillus terrae]
MDSLIVDYLEKFMLRKNEQWGPIENETGILSNVPIMKVTARTRRVVGILTMNSMESDLMRCGKKLKIK